MIKKLFFASTCLLIANSSVNAQESNYLPSEGDWAISLDATPFLNYFGNIIGGTSDVNAPPTWNYLTSNQTITGRYFLSNTKAIRGSVRIGFGSNKGGMNVADRTVTAGPIFPAISKTVENTWNDKMTNVGLAAGLEFRRGQGRLQGFYGGELGFGIGTSSSNFTYGNTLTQGAAPNVDVDAADDMGLSNLSTDPYGNTSRILSSKNGTTFGFGLRGFIGAEYFVRQKISISGEFGWGVTYITGGTSGIEMESEGLDGGGTEVLGSFNTETPNGSSFGFDTESLNTVFGSLTQIKISFYISDKHAGGKFKRTALDDLMGKSLSDDVVTEVVVNEAPAVDSDLDGLSDDEEASIGTNPNNADSDNDGLNDGEEVTANDNKATTAVPTGKSNPNDSCDPDNTGSSCDMDGDGLTNGDEASKGTDPKNPDTDGDGVKDNADACPTEKGTDSKGCPELVPTPNDNDGDGLKNVEETKIGTDSNNPDTDGDSVLDGVDKCPLIAGKVELNGCALSDEELLIIKNASEHIYFNSGSSVIKSESYVDLDKLASILVKHTEVKATIEGHTDSSGGAVANKNLSQSRANAVKKYLMEKGVKGDHLTAIGYGEEKPIADNSTTAGRSKNRRVIVQTTMFGE